MPEENNSRMDEQLRKYARQRRAGAKFDLHPATRRMLQDEVKKVYGREGAGGSEGRKSWIVMFWPHLAAAMTVALLLALSIGLFRPKDPELAADTTRPADMRENLEDQSAFQKNTAASKDIALVPPPEQDLDLGRRSETVVKKAEVQDEQKRFYAEDAESRVALGVKLETKKEGNETEKMKQLAGRVLIEPAAPAPVVAPQQESAVEALQRAAPQPTGAVLAETELFAKLDDLASTPTPTAGVAGAAEPANLAFSRAREQTSALQPAASAPAASPRPAAGLEKMNNLGAALRRDFVVLTNGTPGQQTGNIVWPASFQMEQLGEQVRFSDASGSTFVGDFQKSPAQPADYFAVESRTRAIRPSEALTNAPAPPGNAAFYFKATGLNRTLGKSLVFEGQYFEPTNRAQSSASTAPVTAQRAATVRGGSGPSRPTIIGRVLVDGTNALPLRAVSPER